MSKAWDVNVHGRDHSVTVEPSETGKDVVRVNGRTVARPLNPDEQERVFAIEGLRYNLRRTGAHEFELEQVDVEAPPQMDAAAYVPHRAADMVAPPSFRDSNLPRLVIWGVIAAAIGAILYYAAGPGYAEQASTRVKTMMDDMKDGPEKESQISVAIWERNVRNMDSGELAAASDRFEKWRREKRFYGPFPAYQIVSSEEVDGTDVPTAIVTFEAAGKTYKIRVPQDQRISWAE